MTKKQQLIFVRTCMCLTPKNVKQLKERLKKREINKITVDVICFYWTCSIDKIDIGEQNCCCCSISQFAIYTEWHSDLKYTNHLRKFQNSISKKGYSNWSSELGEQQLLGQEKSHSQLWNFSLHPLTKLALIACVLLPTEDNSHCSDTGYRITVITESSKTCWTCLFLDDFALESP